MTASRSVSWSSTAFFVATFAAAACRSPIIAGDATSGSGEASEPGTTSAELDSEESGSDDQTPLDVGEPDPPPFFAVDLVVYPGHGDGTFDPGVTTPTPELRLTDLDPWCHGTGDKGILVAGFDVDGDGPTDVAVALGGQTLVAFGDGSFGFGDAVLDLETSLPICRWAVGRLFEDGQDDLVGLPCDGQSGFVSIFRGGSRPLPAASELVVKDSSSIDVVDAESVDLDDDGRDELVVMSTVLGDESTNRVTVFSRQGDEFVGVEQWFGGAQRTFYALDLDGDGVLDLLHIAGLDRPHAVHVLADWQGDRFELRDSRPWDAGGVGCPRAQGRDDVDGDGRADLLMIGDGGAARWPFSVVAIASAGVPLPHFGAVSMIEHTAHSRALATGDLDGDGLADLVRLHDGNGDDEPHLSCLLNRTPPTAATLLFEPAAAVLPPVDELSNVHAFNLVDVDDDGQLDIIALRSNMDPHTARRDQRGSGYRGRRNLSTKR